MLIALIITLLTGFFNGVLVMATRLPSFIITLGSLFIFRGLAVAIPRLMTNRTQLGGFEDYDSGGWAAAFATKIELGGARFDIAIIWWIVIAAIATVVLLKTHIGNWIFGTGGDANAARNVGVPVAKLKIALFMVTALAAFTVALIQATQLNSADSPAWHPQGVRGHHRSGGRRNPPDRWLRVGARAGVRRTDLRHGAAGHHHHRR